MEERDLLANRFEEHRPRLRALAYRMLGSPSEADDAVQEAWLRLDRSDSGGVENLGGWLTTVVGRVCLNMLRSRGSRRERFLDEHWGETSDARMPDPLVDREDSIDPEHQALLADGIYQEAARHYDEPTLAALIIEIALINFWNRTTVAVRQVAGSGPG